MWIYRWYPAKSMNSCSLLNPIGCRNDKELLFNDLPQRKDKACAFSIQALCDPGGQNIRNPLRLG